MFYSQTTELFDFKPPLFKIRKASRSLVLAPTPSCTLLELSTCFAFLSSLLASQAQLTSVLRLPLTPYVEPFIKHRWPHNGFNHTSTHPEIYNDDRSVAKDIAEC